ncbi:ABC transporter permease [Parasphaerochaeta coccoides]|nr:ABC transporter permease subunit [Parasphaerochaeta coccoides]
MKGEKNAEDKGNKAGNLPAAILRGAISAIFWILVWYAAYRLTGQDILVASPSRVAGRLWFLAGTSSFWLTVLVSFLHVAEGLVTGCVAGIVLAVLTWRCRLCDIVVRPAIGIIKAAPVTSFIILALFWLGRESVAPLITMLMVLPIVWGNVTEGLGTLDRNLMVMARTYRFGRGKTLRFVIVPSLMPYFIAALSSAIGFAWKAGIAAELLANDGRAVGGRINQAKIYLETEDLFAWTIVVIVLSIILEKSTVHFLGRVRMTEAEKR